MSVSAKSRQLQSDQNFEGGIGDSKEAGSVYAARRRFDRSPVVVAGFVPAIHVVARFAFAEQKLGDRRGAAWMPGTSPDATETVAQARKRALSDIFSPVSRE
jgi:hypothetical protein